MENNEIVEIGRVRIRKAETKLIFNLQTNYGVCRFIYWSRWSLCKVRGGAEFMCQPQFLFQPHDMCQPQDLGLHKGRKCQKGEKHWKSENVRRCQKISEGCLEQIKGVKTSEECQEQIKRVKTSEECWEQIKE